MVSDKVIVVLLVVAILLSLISTFVTLSMNLGSLKLPSGGGNTVVYQPQPEEERGQVAVVVQEPK